MTNYPAFWEQMEQIYLTPIEETYDEEKADKNKAIEDARYYLDECCTQLYNAGFKELSSELETYLELIEELK